MILSVILWFMIWGGMFTGLYNVTDHMFANFLSMFQGMRAFLPLVALYISIMWMFLARIKPPSFSSPIGLFFYYCIIGVLISFFSPKMTEAFYWSFLYLSPIVFLWAVSTMEEALPRLRCVIYINYGVSLILLVSFMPEVIGKAIGSLPYTSYYNLGLNLGQVTKNGVGRFALVVVIVAIVRILSLKKVRRYVWITILAYALFLLMQTQSRTALLGLAVAGFLFVLIKGLKWQFLFIGPLFAYVLWVSGYELRAQQNFYYLVGLTGRQVTWKQALAQIKLSPFLGWGFHADRILLRFQHMHNSYLHALINTGIVGTFFFIGGVASIWHLIVKNRLIRNVREADEKNYPMLVESLLLIGALTARSFFESTAAFYGVDLLLFMPAIAYVSVWIKKEYIKVQIP